MNDALTSFSFEFQDKIALERRADNLETSIEFFEKRIDRLSDLAVRPWTTKRLNSFRDRLTAAQEELDFINDELISYTDLVEQPRDTFDVALSTSTLTNGRAFTSATVSINDSLFDETFESGDQLNVRAYATKPGKKRKARFKTFEIDINGGEGGEGTFTFGSTRLGSMVTKYDNLTIDFLNSDGDTIHSEEWAVNNIV